MTNVRWVQDLAILSPEGDLADVEETDELGRMVENLTAAGNTRLLIDLGECTRIGSDALGVLISAHSSYARRGGQMKLCCADRSTVNIFVITKLLLVCDAFRTVEAAIRWFFGGDDEEATGTPRRPAPKPPAPRSANRDLPRS